MAALNLVVIVSGFSFVCFIIGFHNFLTSHEENGCEMTYMFEYPQFVKISLSPSIALDYPRYGLYAYGEGQYTEKLRKMKFNGIPVLFIPGNGGSHKQVRSLASVSFRKAISAHSPYHFDYFVVDFNEEYSALFGGVLKEQTEFVHHCIKRILQLYVYTSNSPKSVILIGHSMGGMVARGLFLEPDFNPKHVHVIISLATPHKSPVLTVDSYLADYYNSVNEYWAANRHKSQGNLSHITFVSIGGGHRDLLVRSELTHSDYADINTLSTSVPTVWLSTDHLCSVWCKQLVLVIVRSLFDIIDPATKQVSKNIVERKTVFRYHLLRRTAGKRFAGAFHPHEIVFGPNGMWKETLERQYSIVETYGVRSTTYYMIRLLDDPKHELLTVEAINHDTKDWVFVCHADVVQNGVRVCRSGINLSNMTKVIPSGQSKRKIVQLNLFSLKQKSFSHVVLRVPPTYEKVEFNVDVYSSTDRHIVFTPSRMSSLLSKQVILSSSTYKAVHYKLKFPGFEHVWKSYLLYVEPWDCQKSDHHAVATMKVPWRREDTYITINENHQEPLELKLHTAKPSSYQGNNTVTVDLLLDPTCRYSVRVRTSVPGILGQMVRFNWNVLPAFMAAILLLVLRRQVQSLGESGQCMSFHSALGDGAKPYYILPPVRLASQVLSGGIVAQLLPLPDVVGIQDHGIAFFLMFLLLYQVAFAICYLLGIGCWAAVIFSGHAAHKIVLRFMAKAVTGMVSWTEWLVAGLAQLPLVVAAFLIALSYTTCGALSLTVGAGFYYLRLCKMYEDYLDYLFKYSIKLIARKLKGAKLKAKQDESGDKELGEQLGQEDVQNTLDSENQYNSTQEGTSKKQGIAQEESRDQEESLKEHLDRDEDKDEPAEHSGGQYTSDAEGSHEEEEHTFEKKSICQEIESSESLVPVNSEEAVLWPKDEEYSLSELHLNFTILLLWLTSTLISAPSVIVWAHNFGYNSKLQPDPTFMSGFTLSFCAGLLWRGKLAKPYLKHYRIMMHLLYILSVLTLIYAPTFLYRLGPLIGVAFAAFTVFLFVAREDKKTELSTGESAQPQTSQISNSDKVKQN